MFLLTLLSCLIAKSSLGLLCATLLLKLRWLFSYLWSILILIVWKYKIVLLSLVNFFKTWTVEVITCIDNYGIVRWKHVLMSWQMGVSKLLKFIHDRCHWFPGRKRHFLCYLSKDLRCWYFCMACNLNIIPLQWYKSVFVCIVNFFFIYDVLKFQVIIYIHNEGNV